jgi:hypothetical protein
VWRSPNARRRTDGSDSRPTAGDRLSEDASAKLAEERLTVLVRRDRLTGEAAFASGKLACLQDVARSDARDRWPTAWESARAKRLRNWFS